MSENSNTASRERMATTAKWGTQLAWPVAVTVLVFAFYTPLYDLVEAFSVSLSGAQTIKIGELEITSPNKLPDPSDDVAKAINALDKDGLLFLLDLKPNGGTSGPCFVKDNAQDVRRLAVFQDLERVGLIRLTPKKEEHDWCPNPHQVSLTKLGINVRTYVLDLMITLLKIC